MSIRYWQNQDDKTLIQCTIEGDWSWENFQETLQQIRSVILPIHERTDLIIDMSEAGPLPMSAATLRFKSMLDLMPTQFGVVAIVTDDTYTRMVLDSLSRAMPETRSRIFAVDTMKSAQRMIQIGRGTASSDNGIDALTRPVIPRY